MYLVINTVKIQGETRMKSHLSEETEGSMENSGGSRGVRPWYPSIGRTTDM